MHDHHIDTIKQMLELASKNRHFANKDHRQLYQQGYLIGILAALMSDDYYTECYVAHRVKELDQKK